MDVWTGTATRLSHCLLLNLSRGMAGTSGSAFPIFVADEQGLNLAEQVMGVDGFYQ